MAKGVGNPILRYMKMVGQMYTGTCSAGISPDISIILVGYEKASLCFTVDVSFEAGAIFVPLRKRVPNSYKISMIWKGNPDSRIPYPFTYTNLRFRCVQKGIKALEAPPQINAARGSMALIPTLARSG